MGTTWTNDDGLLVEFGTRTASERGGSPRTSGNTRELVLELGDATTLGTTVSTQDLIGAAYMPANAIVTKVTAFVDTTFTSGGAAKLQVGTFNADTGATIAVAGLASMAVAGLTSTAADVVEGTVVPAVTTVNTAVGLTYVTAAFTAGKGRVVIEYSLVG